MSDYLMGVKIDFLSMDQAVEICLKWLKKRGKYYIATPNPEMVVDSQSDSDFKLALNKADLAIADSTRLGWAKLVIDQESFILRWFYAGLFGFPKLIPELKYYRVTRGVDLMEKLIAVSEEKGFTTAYLGGSREVALKLHECLGQKYPRLKILFCSGNVEVAEDGKMSFDTQRYNNTLSKDIKSNIPLNPHILSRKIDILFVAFGHKKQEKWMNKNLGKLNARIMVGVGGAFDYLSGSVPRAPKFLRDAGLEWIFRLTIQPWRVKRFWKLFRFVYMVLAAGK